MGTDRVSEEERWRPRKEGVLSGKGGQRMMPLEDSLGNWVGRGGAVCMKWAFGEGETSWGKEWKQEEC